MFRILLFTLALFFSHSFGLENMRCGTLQFAENLKNPKKRMLAKAGCIPENLYGVVDSRKTAHFIIYYTKSGSHAIRYNSYIDSLALYLEQAYKLHKDSLGMKSISGARKTYHYEQNVPDGFYPVEVIDTGLLRGYEGEYSNTFGITYPGSNSRETEIIIENDFLYGADCSGNPSKSPFVSKSTGVDYSTKWDWALKATVFHELYHAFQITYYNWLKYHTLWLEASAAGVEEIGAPEVNDYINYLDDNFKNLGKSMEQLSRDEEYGWAAFYLFLYSKLGHRFDSAIWNYFSKEPKDNFAKQLERYVDSLQRKDGFDISAEDLFHKYASQVFYSGSRSKFSPYELFWVDMPKWPNWRINRTAPSVLQPGTIDFIKTANEPNTASVARKSALQDGDSTKVWILSRLLEKESVAPDTVKEIIAYPNPWNPMRNPKMQFKNLPKEAKGIEIRSANGALLKRIKRESGDSLFWVPEKRPAPGILYYRTLPYGKNKVLIVQY
jgi:hypothetical protein